MSAKFSDVDSFYPLTKGRPPNLTHQYDLPKVNVTIYTVSCLPACMEIPFQLQNLSQVM